MGIWALEAGLWHSVSIPKKVKREMVGEGQEQLKDELEVMEVEVV